MAEPVATRPLWERLEHEPGKQYAAFCIYRNLGRSRTLAEAYSLYRELAPDKKKKSSDPLPPYYAGWSADYMWRERCAQYDAHLETVLREAEENELQKRAKVWVERFNNQREAEWSLAQKVQALAEAKIATLEVGEDLDARDVLSFLKVSSALSRLAVGENTVLRTEEEGERKRQVMRFGNMEIEF